MAESDAGSHQGREAYGWIMRVLEAEGPTIMRMLHGMLGNRADVLDAYQDCFCRLAARGEAGTPASARAYVYRTATNVAIEMVRTRARRRAHWPAVAAKGKRREEDGATAGIPGEEPAPDGGVDIGAIRNDALREGLTRLPAHLRNVVMLRDLCRMPYNEVGRMLGIDPATARVYRRHAVVKLAEMMGDEEPQP